MRGERFREAIHALSLHDVIILTKSEMPNARNESSKVGSGPISIIVPVLNEAASIERFLRRLRERAGDAELIIVDGGSSDGTFDLARNRCDRCLPAPPGRAVQMNKGARAASGDTFWFVHSDCEVPPGCLQQIADVPLMEDAEFFRTLRRVGRIANISSRLISSARRYQEIGPWRLTLTYGLIALLYLLGVPISVLAAIYRKT